MIRRVLIIGAGAQGGPCAAILAGEKDITEIRVGDINLDLAKKVADRINSKKIAPLRLDAGKQDEVIKAADGVDVIFNFTLIKYNNVIMEAALASQSHYVDTACNTKFLQHWITGKAPEFHGEFIALGKTALVGCGFAPGIANVLTRYACDQMDRVSKVLIRVARASGTGSGEVVSAWNPTWSPEILLEDYAEPPMVFKDGKFVEVPIFSNPETYTFADPVGEVLISSHSHEETYLIPKFYMEKGIQDIDFKYPVNKLVGAFIKMGFSGEEPIDVDGVKIVPQDVLMKLVKRPGNKFIKENQETILQSDLTGIMDISVEGEQQGESLTQILTYRFTDGPNHERQRRLFNAFGTTMVYVALPAVVGAKMCVNGEVENGVVSPDSLDPHKFFDGMAERGVPFDFEEKIVKQTVIKGG